VRLESIEGGGHLSFVTHEEQVLPLIVSFLQAHTP
jgi:hypothetical protein